jgi:hypothetical protein
MITYKCVGGLREELTVMGLWGTPEDGQQGTGQGPQWVRDEPVL